MDNTSIQFSGDGADGGEIRQNPGLSPFNAAASAADGAYHPGRTYTDCVSNFNDPQVQKQIFEDALSSDSDSIDDDALRSMDAFSTDSEELEIDENVSNLDTVDLDGNRQRDGSPMNVDYGRTNTANSAYFSVRMESVYGANLLVSNRLKMKD